MHVGMRISVHYQAESRDPCVMAICQSLAQWQCKVWTKSADSVLTVHAHPYMASR